MIFVVVGCEIRYNLNTVGVGGGSDLGDIECVDGGGLLCCLVDEEIRVVVFADGDCNDLHECTSDGLADEGWKEHVIKEQARALMSLSGKSTTQKFKSFFQRPCSPPFFNTVFLLYFIGKMRLHNDINHRRRHHDIVKREVS